MMLSQCAQADISHLVVLDNHPDQVVVMLYTEVGLVSPNLRFASWEQMMVANEKSNDGLMLWTVAQQYHCLSI